MRIKARDGKTYEVKPTNRVRYEVFRDEAHVAYFLLKDDDTEAGLLPEGTGKVSKETVLEVAQEFVDRGGAPVRMM
jgi:hypothetical protein